MKTILVTGGTGYIGSHTCIELLNAGYQVIIMDNLSRSDKFNLDRIEKISGKKTTFIAVDLCNENDLQQAFEKINTPIDAVIHFAAYKAVGESVDNPLMYYYNNLFSIVNLLKQLEKNKISNIVFSSSCTVYGQSKDLPVLEESALIAAESPYGNTKQISEEILKDTCKSNTNLNCVSLRYFNPIGAHPTALLGELPIGVPNNLVPYITQTAIGKRKQLQIFGNDYNTPDGTCIRDYIHVVDLAQAHLCAIQLLLEKKQASNFEVFNIGTGKGSSVLETINTFENISNTKLNYAFAPRRSGDVVSMYANTQKANNILNWECKYTLAEALLHQWNWEQALAKK